MKERIMNFRVSNFGPIIGGEFQLKPLTVFIGPNNSGKTYSAELVYSILQCFKGRPKISAIYGPPPIHEFARQKIKINDELISECKKWAKGKYSEPRKGKEISIKVQDLPDGVIVQLSNIFKKLRIKVSDDLENSLKDYLGCENVDELIRKGKSINTMSFQAEILGEREAFISYEVRKKRKQGTCKIGYEEIPKKSAGKLRRDIFQQVSRDSELVEPVIAFVFNEIWNSYLKEKGLPTGAIYYLPAGRSGILLGWQVLASVAVDIARERWGFEPIEIPALTGVGGDFLQLFMRGMIPSYPSEKKDRNVVKIKELLESDLLKGETLIRRTRRGGQILVYKTAKYELPLSRVSSMIAELASLDILLRRGLSKNDLIIIDEPESHLHPEGQRIIARVITRLVNAGIKVLITTHSSMIIHQFSNQIMLGKASRNQLPSLGMVESDILKADDVGIFLFSLSEQGSNIQNINIDKDYGIPEDEYIRISDAIGEETERLYTLGNVIKEK